MYGAFPSLASGIYPEHGKENGRRKANLAYGVACFLLPGNIKTVAMNGVFRMDKQLQALLFEPWANGACLGYAIKAMENLNYKPENIQAIVSEMKWLFDIIQLKEAEKHYCNSPY